MQQQRLVSTATAVSLPAISSSMSPYVASSSLTARTAPYLAGETSFYSSCSSVIASHLEHQQ
ncbi:MAG: hypothetical protein ACK51L_01210 [bacterium]